MAWSFSPFLERALPRPLQATLLKLSPLLSEVQASVRVQSDSSLRQDEVWLWPHTVNAQITDTIKQPKITRRFFHPTLKSPTIQIPAMAKPISGR